MRVASKVRRRRPSRQAEVVKLVHRLANNCKDPVRLLELFYWGREPELAKFMRYFIALPDETKSALHAFLRMSEGSLHSVAITVNANGDLTLSSPAVTDLLTLVDASPAEKPTQLLH